MNNVTLRETIARTWYAHFHYAELSKASEFRKMVAYEITDFILVALRDYSPSDVMISAWHKSIMLPDHCADIWRTIIQAAMEER